MLTEAVILAQGNELTQGLTLDTNSHWLASRLVELGITVRRVMTAPDRLEDIVEILRRGAELAPIVVSTGGLGPTRDDLTAQAAALAFGGSLRLHEDALAQVQARFVAFGRVMAEVNRKQAVLPDGCRVLENLWGTAPGFSVDSGSSRLYFLPGVPREMKPMFDRHVLPDVLARHRISAPLHVTVRVTGVPESVLEEKMQGLERPGLEIGFRTKLPENHVKLRFEPGFPAAERLALVEEVRARIGWRAFGVDSGDLAEVVGQALAARGETLALAESCTAGSLSAWVGSVPGASRYLLEGAVVYSNEAKVRTCGVDPALLEEHGAVSEPVARQLARGIRARAGATWGIGITGIAGPGGGTEAKPVGTVHVALAGPETFEEHRALRIPGDRARVVSLSAAAALEMLWRRLSV